MGLTFLFSEPVPALALFVMSAVLIPPVLKWLEERLKFKLSTVMRVVVLVIGFFVVGSILEPVEESEIENLESVQSEEVTESNTNANNAAEVEEPLESEPFIIKHGNLVIGEQCQDECFDKVLQLVDAGAYASSQWDLKACQVSCQTQIEIDAEKEASNQESASTSIAEYEIKNTEDISIKALGGQDPSSYSIEQLESMPNNKKMSYDVVVSSGIKENQVKPTIEAIINDLTAKDPEIDEIILLFYSDAELIGQGYDVARAIWAPKGELGNVNADIAQSNNRSSYSISIDVKEGLEEYLLNRGIEEDKFGLSTDQRKIFFKEYVAVERQAMDDADQMYPIDVSDSDWEEVRVKNTDTYFELMEQYKAEVANEYNLTESQVDEIRTEAFENNWPMY